MSDFLFARGGNMCIIELVPHAVCDGFHITFQLIMVKVRMAKKKTHNSSALHVHHQHVQVQQTSHRDVVCDCSLKHLESLIAGK